MFHNLKKVLQGKKLSTNVGDEGGFAPDLKSDANALEVIVEAMGRAGYEPGNEAFGQPCFGHVVERRIANSEAAGSKAMNA